MHLAIEEVSFETNCQFKLNETFLVQCTLLNGITDNIFNQSSEAVLASPVS
jgi:hypothetical protein